MGRDPDITTQAILAFSKMTWRQRCDVILWFLLVQTAVCICLWRMS